jgi:hypothetical protein
MNVFVNDLKEKGRCEKYIRSKVFTDDQAERLYKVLRLAFEKNFTVNEIYNFFFNSVRKGWDIDKAIMEFERKIIEKRLKLPSGFYQIGDVLETIMSDLRDGVD